MKREETSICLQTRGVNKMRQNEARRDKTGTRNRAREEMRQKEMRKEKF